MGSVFHGCARTAPRVRAKLQASKQSTRALATRYGLNPKTVTKWRTRTTTTDAPMGAWSREVMARIVFEELRILIPLFQDKANRSTPFQHA
ncbi:hypothetical protein GCM10017624_41190 [Azotobacter vinelandii]|nr:hypothetical protein GCM10017624_41190 [Azotobacter vinelandii]SFY07071.1 hypothetical protein SAMN04244547_03848 [Azotobacter vinelandii]